MEKPEVSVYERISFGGLVPISERDAAHALARKLTALTDYAETFENTVALFAYSRDLIKKLDTECAQEPLSIEDFMNIDMDERSKAHKHYMKTSHRYSQWVSIAARDGAMTIFHFGMTVQAVNYRFSQCPAVWALVPRAALKRANREFNTKFPDFEAMRNAIAHQAELDKTDANRKRNSVSQAGEVFGSILNGTDTMVSGCIANDIYYSSYNGRIVSYEISDDTTTKLKSVAECFYEVADIVIKILKDRDREEWLKRRDGIIVAQKHERDQNDHQ